MSHALIDVETPTLQQTLRNIVADVVENHPGPDTAALIEDVVMAITDGLSLRSREFVDDNDEDAPITRVCFIDGRIERPLTL